MELLYKVNERPSWSKTLVFALQQLLSIIAGTVAVPLIIGHGMSQSAALFGAAVGTLVYLAITKFKSPVFLGSSFTFIGSMSAAFAGAATAAIGFVGLFIGAALAGLLYVILSIIVHFTGTKWVNKLMPPVIIGPTVAIIALTLSPNAINNITKGDVFVNGSPVANPYICLMCGLITLIASVIAAVYGKKMVKLAPFIFGILAGYGISLLLTAIGNATDTEALMIINFEPFKHISWVPDFNFLKVFQGLKEFSSAGEFWSYFGFIALTYVPVAFAVFAEHIADHRNISYIIETDLLKDPGLSRTLMGDGVGSVVGSFFGGCPNTTYGESISCLAFSKNASIITIVVTSLMAIAISFFGPLMTFFATIPACVVGGLSIALYGFIAISGFQMLKKVDLNQQKNIFVIATIFIFGIGGLTIKFYHVEFSPVACAMVAGILMNFLVNIKFKRPKKKETEAVVKEKEKTS